MEDFHYAGGLPVVLRALGENGLLHRDAGTVNGRTIWQNAHDAPCWNHEVITPMAAPFKAEAGIAILTGNLCPDGAVIKPSAASPELMRHTGRAVVFESVEAMHDMIRISDARMLGTAYGTVVLHVAPEATVGGPLALVQNGDLITLDVPGRSLHLHVSEAELAARRAAWVAPEPHAARGYAKLYLDHVLQADRGADFDFLVGRTGSPVPRDNH